MNGAKGFPVRTSSAEARRSWWDEEPVGFDLCKKIKLAVNLLLVYLGCGIAKFQEQVSNFLNQI